MLHVADIQAHKTEYLNALKKRNFDAGAIFEELLETDQKRRNTQSQLDNTLAESNKLSKEIGERLKAANRKKPKCLRSKAADLNRNPRIFRRS